MRFWLPAIVFAAALVSACGGRPVVAPTLGTPQYPEFVEPRVPDALAAMPAASVQSRAWRFLQAGDLRSAEREANAVLKSAPAFFPAETTLGYIDLARKAPEDAVAKFDRVLGSEAAYAPALAGKGQALSALDRDDEALAAFEAALAADASLAGVARRADVVRLRLSQRSITAARDAAGHGRFDDAMTAYRAALARSPDSAFLYRELAIVERDHGNGDNAVALFRRAIELDSTDVASLVDLADMLAARNEFDAALPAYADALAIEPDPAVAARRDAVRLRAEIAGLPAEYRAIEGAAQITRGDLAALVGFRLQTLLAGSGRDVGVITDIRGHWAESWILDVARAGIMDPFDNHTFQPGLIVRRSDLAQVITRLLARVAAVAPAEARRWQAARGRFSDLSETHMAYPAASTAVAAGVMSAAADGSFQPSGAVSGAEATAAVVRILDLSRTQERP